MFIQRKAGFEGENWEDKVRDGVGKVSKAFTGSYTPSQALEPDMDLLSSAPASSTQVDQPICDPKQFHSEKTNI